MSQRIAIIFIALVSFSFWIGKDGFDYEPFPEMIIPSDNSLTAERIELGRKLFYDPILSADRTISCSSCHIPSLAFSDSVAFSLGVNDALGTRNAPSLMNVGYHPYLLREGGVPTLEMQVLVPLQEHNEMASNILIAAERLKLDSTYVQMCEDAYDREPDAFCITRALGSFQRTLISDNSKYDQVMRGEASFSSEEKEGMELFFSDRLNCSNCHGGSNFTDYSFKNNGLYQAYADSGKMRASKLPEDRALFKVPSLRNVSLTAPYMHDGSLETLEEVIEHYNSGGKNHYQQDETVKPLSLSLEEQSALLAFLHSLTDNRTY